MLKSINQIRLELSEIASAHLQINSFFWGDFLRSYKENTELNYPLMGALYPSATLLRNQTSVQLSIYVCDKIYKDWSNLNDVESDTLQICRDIYNVMNSSFRWQSIGRVQSCTVTKFIERGGDEVAGHTMTVQFLIRDRAGVCDLPMTGYDFDNVLGDACLPVQIFRDGVLIDTVNSGSLYQYVTIQAVDVNGTNEGNVSGSSDLSIVLTDGVNQITPASVQIIGNTITITI